MTQPKPTGQPTMGVEFLPDPANQNWEKLSAELEAEAAVAMEAFRHAIEWAYQDTARKSLKTTSDKYLEGLSVTLDDDGVQATIEGWLPVALEDGAGAFDMKPGLLAGRSKRVIPMHKGGFATVSVFSRPGSWWHPGIQARNISEQVKTEADDIRKRIIDPVIEKFMQRVEV